VVSQQNADITNTLQLRDVAMANIFWLSVFAVHIGTTQRIRLNRPCAAAMRPYVKLLSRLVIILLLLVPKADTNFTVSQR